MKISIVVSTYNRPDALEAVLTGLSNQSNSKAIAWEVIVADDGSSKETKEAIQRIAQSFPTKLTHIWHEDKGFRLAAIRNLSVQHAAGEYIVFIDGDCIPMHDFLEKSKKIAERNYVVAGNRILLNQEQTSRILSNPASYFNPSLTKWFTLYLQKKSNKLFPKLRIPLGVLRKARSTKWEILKGCNIGVWKTDFIQIGGFDESFSGWGHEDSDFAIRLLNYGIKIKDGRFAVPVIHLWHLENDRGHQRENWEKLQQTLKSGRIHPIQGLHNQP
ncbi:glycosyltransferase family 2 protein [Chitinibacter tainanensis]|uniref:glycosyltransferase family 2 protein n=1 Tax=Chitinibacter tainanensis TaxID=230667 RepID=UPI00055030D3|nr:glycosyltransferase family 2 protein [Chitinibacter tainanensis]